MARVVHTQEEISQRLASLPKDIQDLIYSADMDSIVRQIGAKEHLHIDQMGLLAGEVVQVMLGFTPPGEFVQNLMDMLEIERDKADAVMQDVNDMLFLKIRESMKRVQMGEVIPAAPLEPTTSAAAPTSPLPTPVIAPAPTAAVPQKTPEVHPADFVLTQKTISVPTTAPQATQGTAQNVPINPSPTVPQVPKPPPYKTDPYREPTE